MGFTGMSGIRGVTGSVGGVGIPASTLTWGQSGGSTGMVGATGMMGVPGIPPTCVVCLKTFSEYQYFDINFNPDADIREYRVCKKCLRVTKVLLRNIKKLEMIRMPLHVNHTNIFVKEAVKNRLLAGV